MKIVLATGIYPPDIGGPATYVSHLAKELSMRGHEIVVMTYKPRGHDIHEPHDGWKVMHVSRGGGPLLRWWRFAQALKKHASDADIIYAFSSVSCGMPLLHADLKKPKKILRLGGDFFWERYTDRGGRNGLRAWYEGKPRSRAMMQRILQSFDHIVFSTEFQQKMYEEHYTDLPTHSVIENAIPMDRSQHHSSHDPMRILFMGRFVGFKNLSALIDAIALLPIESVQLTLVGDGPIAGSLKKRVDDLNLGGNIVFVSSVHGEEKQHVFAQHDVLAIPSITEISPNVALEAVASGLPVLLTEETGLSEKLSDGMIVRDLSTTEKIAEALEEVRSFYADFAKAAAKPTVSRSWLELAEQHETFFQSLL